MSSKATEKDVTQALAKLKLLMVGRTKAEVANLLGVSLGYINLVLCGAKTPGFIVVTKILQSKARINNPDLEKSAAAKRPRVSRKVRDQVRNKLAAMCRFSDQGKVAAKFGLHRASLSKLVNGKSNPSQKLAELVLGEKSEKRRIVDASVNAVRLQHAERLRAGDQADRGLRDQPVPEPDRREVLDLPRPGRGDDELRLEKQEKVIPMPKSQRLELELQNKARSLAGLGLLKVKVYACSVCRNKFESTGARFCSKCRNVSNATISGREVYE